MLSNLPVELFLLILSSLSLDDCKQLAWTTRRIIKIIRKYRPLVLLPRINSQIDKIIIRPRNNGKKVSELWILYQT